MITDNEGNTFSLTTDATGMYMAEVPIGITVIDIDESTLPRGYEQTVGTDLTTVNVRSGRTATDLDGYYFPPELPTSSPTGSRTATPTVLPTTSRTALPTKSPSAPQTSSPTAALIPKSSGKVKGSVFEDVNNMASRILASPQSKEWMS